MTPEDGRARYEQARRAGRAKPADALRTTPTTAEETRAALDKLAAICHTPTPAGVCGHTNSLHEEGTRKGQRVATRCTIMTAAGPCGCRLFQLTGENDDGTDEPVGPQ